MGGCDWQKRSFKVALGLHSCSIPFLEKTCEGCKNKNSEKCEDCTHWKFFERRDHEESNAV